MLTPFAGAGSECVAAKMTGRHYIGFELEEEYCNIAEERLRHVDVEISEQMDIFQNEKEVKNYDETSN